ncbi:MAG: ABC-F type ribosomal protection protein [Lachnospiraceae bacterium]|jgi:lincosamide and streptogramin A transport system ATP-binding/permease protein|nr:ABC-F type ribosomal protection protein [Lachnospiraceae bacterium]
MSLINITNLTFAYDGSYDDIFTDVSFQIDTAWKLGFCGRNGRGKTTFLKLLLGQYEYRGTITANVNFEYFPYPLDTLAQNTFDILSAIAPDAPPWQIEKELGKLAVAEDALYRPFATLSNGEQTKALLAGLFLRENSFLLIDEPTNHLDMAARETVARYLKDKAGFILVSHDRAFLDECVDHILSINKANIEIQRGNFSSWFLNKQRQDEYELAENERLKKDIVRLETAIRRTASWSDKAEGSKIGFDPRKTEKSAGHRPYEGEKSRKMMARSKALQKRQQRGIAEKSKLLKNIEAADDLQIRPLAYHASRLLALENVAVNYGEKEIFSEVSFTLAQGERLALLGGNGSGKSSLLKMICGEDIPHRGILTIGSRLAISYVPQDASFLAGSLDDYAAEQEVDITIFKALLRKLDFSRVQFDKDMRDFSAGQKKKVLLARSLCQRAHVYIWDEPLNYIDVLSRIQIEELILAYEPTLIFVEHDRAFCDNIATQTVALKPH